MWQTTMYDDCKWAYAYQYSLLIEECAVATRDRSDLALPQRAEAAARRQADLPMHKEKWILQNERGFAVLSAVEDGLSLARAVTRHSKRDWFNQPASALKTNVICLGGLPRPTTSEACRSQVANHRTWLSRCKDASVARPGPKKRQLIKAAVK
jgi:hypothetical protein